MLNMWIFLIAVISVYPSRHSGVLWVDHSWKWQIFWGPGSLFYPLKLICRPFCSARAFIWTPDVPDFWNRLTSKTTDPEAQVTQVPSSSGPLWNFSSKANLPSSTVCYTSFRVDQGQIPRTAPSWTHITNICLFSLFCHIPSTQWCRKAHQRRRNTSWSVGKWSKATCNCHQLSFLRKVQS